MSQPRETHDRKSEKEVKELTDEILEPVPIPDGYLCPILKEIMHDPVVAGDGFSYERKAITEWIRRGHRKSPMTGEELGHTLLIPNITLKVIIRDFEENLPTILRNQQIQTDLKIAIELREKFVDDLLKKNAQLQGEMTKIQLEMKKMNLPSSPNSGSNSASSSSSSAGTQGLSFFAVTSSTAIDSSSSISSSSSLSSIQSQTVTQEKKEEEKIRKAKLRQQLALKYADELVKNCISGDLKEVKNLVSKGADVNQPDKSGITPLLGAYWGLNTDIIQHLGTCSVVGITYKQADQELKHLGKYNIVDEFKKVTCYGEWDDWISRVENEMYGARGVIAAYTAMVGEEAHREWDDKKVSVKIQDRDRVVFGGSGNMFEIRSHNMELKQEECRKQMEALSPNIKINMSNSS